MVVPGFGPYRYLAHEFHHELSGGTFWRLVVEAVTGAGAQKDIFPSLHTAAPTFFTLFSYRHRARLPFKYSWPFVGFVCSQIIVATMFLRWHYLIDICAGVALAAVCVVASERLSNWERDRRRRLDLCPTFGPPPLALLLPDPAPVPAPDR
jgi:membrane-associated phospholipid phosphatase